jgi:aminopeptidase
MADSRYEKLARVLLGYSCALQPGERVLIEAIDVPHEFTNTLVRLAAGMGAHPLVLLKSQLVHRELLLAATAEQLEVQAASEAALMSSAAAYLGLRGGDNVSEYSDVPHERMALWEAKLWKPVHMEIRVPKTRWCVLRWPSSSMAQLAQTSTAAFEDFYFRVCTLDYERMSKAMVPLQQLMMATDRVRLVAPGTDLRFSIRSIPAVLCDGKRNIPDGEVYTAPVRDSVEGTIQYNAPTLYRGVTHENVRFRFEQGRIVEASSSQPEALERVLASDEGARYVGEFAIGFHPGITAPMKDILFDEKIAGSIHFTPGAAYQEADNGNRSTVHWDLVLMMDPAHGGGEIWFDDVLVRKDGRFVLPELEGLNPENLT